MRGEAVHAWGSLGYVREILGCTWETPGCGVSLCEALCVVFLHLSLAVQVQLAERSPWPLVPHQFGKEAGSSMQ